jgi:hypothetical protein
VIVAIALGLMGLSIMSVVLIARYLDVLSWQRSLVAFRLTLPADLPIEQVTNWLTNVAASTEPPRISLLPLPPVAVEIVATPDLHQQGRAASPRPLLPRLCQLRRRGVPRTARTAGET